uniref:Reverse transcriptase domain-containing protein n=1 Tax=Callorhinchus milii TaxID=7868 RepID=A0A4W3GPJ4_CALMI
MVSDAFILDLSVGFDTVDHPILLHHLSSLIHLSGTSFVWFESYLTNLLHFISNVIRRHGVKFHTYADDAQIYFSFCSTNSRSADVPSACLADIRAWMIANFLQLNVNKTEAMLLPPVNVFTPVDLNSSTSLALPHTHRARAQSRYPIRPPAVLPPPQLVPNQDRLLSPSHCPPPTIP